jgi:hypothetical protein
MTLTDIYSSYIPEDPAGVEFCASMRMVPIDGTLLESQTPDVFL